MALTQISTDGVKDNAVTAGKIPANAVGSSELANDAVDTNAIQDDAVTSAKIATSGVESGNIQALAISTAKIQDDAVTADKIADNTITAGQLATNCVNNDELGGNAVATINIIDSNVTTSKIANNAVTLAKLENGTSSNDGKFLRANNGADPTFESVSSRPGRNIIINGAMQVAQRGTSSTSTGFQTCDRWQVGGNYNGTNTQSQADVGYTTTPYDKGFRKSLKVTNGNHSSANASDNIEITYSFEGDEIATSGWDYVSSSKKITLSFWVKSSVAQTFYGYFRTFPGTDAKYSFPIVCSTTGWEFKTVSIIGETNFAQNVYNSFGNGTGRAMVLRIVPFYGTDYTDSGAINNAWRNYSSTDITPVYDTSWFLTNGATFELTGVQLEVGDENTEFEHKIYPDYLRECERYYIKDSYGGIRSPIHGNGARIPLHVLPQAMRTTPSASASTFTEFSSGSARSITAFYLGGTKGGGYAQMNASPGNGVYVYVTFDAEL